MDWVTVKNKAVALLGKYRYAILILLIGAALMLIPTNIGQQGVTPETTSAPAEEVSITEELTQVLSQIKGVGKVRVMLTVASGELTVYQHDEDSQSGENGSIHKQTVIVSDKDRNETGLVQQIIPAKYQGALVVCDGADSPAVCLAVVDAVSKVTGLGSDRIAVLKMK